MADTGLFAAGLVVVTDLSGVLEEGTTMSEREIVAIIPARGGSIGIPRKNIADVCGKPLVAYSIEAALAARRVTRVIVSTDDEEIADVSRQYGADVPFLRPRDIAQARSLVGEAMSFTISSLYEQGYCPDVVAVLFCTHPFRPPWLIDTLLEILVQGYESIVTVKKIPHQPLFYIGSDGALRQAGLREQQDGLAESVRYRSYGLFEAFMQSPQPFGKYLYPVDDPVCLVDVDEPQDLEYARWLVANNLFPE